MAFRRAGGRLQHSSIRREKAWWRQTEIINTLDKNTAQGGALGAAPVR